MLRHHAPLGDDGFAHLPGVLRAGDFVDLHRDFLAAEILQLRRLRIAVGDALRRLGARVTEKVWPLVPRWPPRVFRALSSPDSTSPALINLPAFAGWGSACCCCCACAEDAASATGDLRRNTAAFPH